MQKTFISRLKPLQRLRRVRHVRHVASKFNAQAAQGEYFATCHPGLEEVVAQELMSPAIGAENVRIGKAGVSFSGNVSVMYNANLWLRAAIRVLSLLKEVELDPHVPAGDSIYDAFRDAADWTALLKRGQTFSVDSRIYGNSSFSNSQLLSIRARDAICDSIRDKTGMKPDPPERGRTPDMPLFVTSFQDQLRIYRDCSGVSLHRRGYREAMHAASLNEAAAAGCLYLAGWPQHAQHAAVLVDPMCGSGTFLIEGALMATNVAPGLFRRWWPFLGWPDGNPTAWRDAVQQARDARTIRTDILIFGNDKHSGALSLALRDIKAAGMDKIIRLHHGQCRNWDLPKPPSLVITNPPWGKRLICEDRERSFRDNDRGYGRERGGNRRQDRDSGYGSSSGSAGDNEDDLADAWGSLGTFLKHQAGGTDAYILSGSTKATQHLRLRADKRIPLTVGGVDCRLLQYHIRGLDGGKNEVEKSQNVVEY